MLISMKQKKECEQTPQGYSYSESNSSYYFHIRKGDSIQRIRIKKDDKKWETHKVDHGPDNF